MSSVVWIRGRAWYFRLYNVDTTKGLFNYHPVETIEGKLLVQYEAPPHYTNAKRVYSLFNTIAEYRNYALLFPPEDRCFYESILGRFRQKPHFDIDFEGENEEEVSGRSNTLLLNLCNAIAQLLFKHGITLRRENLLIYTSHGLKKEGYKRSFHLLLNGYYHHNNVEAGAFYEEIMKILYTTPDHEHIDHAVYGSVQQFRMLGSQKYGSARPKVPKGGWKEYDDYFEEILAYRKSIVSDCGDCVPLPFFVQKKQGDYVQDDTFLTESEISEIEELVASHNYTRDCASIREITGAIVALKREQESICPNCNRAHDAENPFLVVDKRGEVWFYCRRDSGRSSMGSISRNLMAESVKTKDVMEEPEVPQPPPIVTMLPPQSINILEYTRSRNKYAHIIPAKTSTPDFLC